jgi:integrase/recombinase XerC
MNDMIISAPGANLTARPQLADMLGRFIDFISVKDVTVKSYTVCLRCFMDWARNSAVTAPTRRDILDYVEWLALPHARRQRQDRPHSSAPAPVITFSAGTQARYLRAVKMFFKWTAQEGLYPNIADNVKGAKVRADNTKRDPLQREDARALLDSIDTDTAAGKRDYAMILLSITAGLRIIEMQRANIGNMETLAGEHVLFIQGKGHDEADTYKKLTPEVYAAIMDYLNTRSTKDPAAPLFAGIGNRSNGGRLAEPSISRIIKDRLRAAGYDTHRISAHSLRHTSVTFLLEAGATIQEAQHHARHASPETTGIYAHNIDQRKQHTEQRVYDYLFGVEQDSAAQAADCFKRMNAEQQRRALDLLRAIAG